MTDASEKLYPWVRLDPSRLPLRLVATRFPSGAERLVVSGASLLTDQEVQGLLSIGFRRSRSGLLMRDGVQVGAQELRRVFPTLTTSLMPKALISRIQPRRPAAETARSIAATAQEEANAAAASREVGRNGRGERVFEGDDGRYVVTAAGEVAARVSEGEGDARFLRASSQAGLAECADAFVAQIAEGRPQRWSDLRRWASVVFDIPEEEIEQTPSMRVAQEAVEAAMVRVLTRHGAADAEAFERARLLEEGQPAFNARTGSSVVNQQYSTPLPIAVAVQHILGDVSGKTVLEPTIGNGSLVSVLHGARISGMDIDADRVAAVRAARPDIRVTEGDFTTRSMRSEREDGRFDVVVANPPFGGLKNALSMSGLRVQRLDYQILMRSLELRSDDGLGVFIVGADSAIDSKAGQLKGGSRYLLNWLADHYKVDAVEVSGDLYAKQGASFPIRIIVVGKKEPNGQPVPDQIPVIDTHEALIEWAGVMRARYAPSPGGDEFDADALELSPGDDGVSSGTAAPQAPADEARFDAGALVRPRAKPRTVADENSFQSPYQPASQVGEGSAMIPRNLATATRHALQRVIDEHGDVDAFVATALGWTVEEMRTKGYLSPEQVDAVALMIYAQQNGRACLEGDVTGLGKGRCMASMARYHALRGQPTVFLTETATLFTDFWRDLQDIGSAELFRPLIVNAGVAIYDSHTGETIVQSTPRSVVQQALDGDTIPAGYNLVLATYSQFNRDRAVSAKARWITGVTRGAQLLLDEAHNAAGDSNTGRNIAIAIANAGAVAYSSATSLKSAKNVVIYNALFPQSVDVASLPDTLAAGGEVLQEVLAGMMARDGVLIRREHDLSDLTFRTVEDSERRARNVELSDRLAEILELMCYLAGDINHMVSERNREIRKLVEAMPAMERSGNRMGAVSMNFGSRLFAIYRQFQLALKVDLTADRCIQALEQGKKPVVVLENTMESLLREVLSNDDVLDADDDLSAALSTKLQTGIVLEEGLTFRHVLHRMLDRLTYYKETGAYGEVTKVPVQSEEAARAIANIRGLIDEFPELPASPLDALRERVEAAGYSMGELSGRSLRIESLRDPVTGSMKATAIVRPERPKAHVVREFNSGEMDALLLTGAGSTGISLHASERFKDQRQRVLIELQSAADVNRRVQFFGRVNRKGQVSAPEIETLSSGLVGESRPIAMQNAKLRRLSANTTANQDSAALDRTVPDFINEVGDMVAKRYLESNPDVARRLDIDLLEADEIQREPTHYISKLTSRIVMLRNSEQEAIYSEITGEYLRVIQDLDEKGINPFKSKDMDLKAVEVGRSVFEAGNAASESVFDHPVYVKTIRYQEEVYPLRAEDVRSRVLQLIANIERDFPGMSVDTTLTRISGLLERSRASLLEQARPTDGRHTVEALLADKEPNAVNRLNARVNFIIQALRELRPGGMVSFTGMENEAQCGIVVGFDFPTNERKLHNPGQYVVKLAVPGQSRVIERSLYALMEDDGYSAAAPGRVPASLWEEFDAAPNGLVTRERLVLDGNLFKAAQLAAKSKIGACVMYTDETGARQRGVLLNNSVTLGRLQSLAVRVESGHVAWRVFAEAPDVRLSTCAACEPEADRDLILAFDGTLLKMTVPGTKTWGGRYFGNEELRALVGEFAGSRSFMTARFAPEKLPAVFDVLTRIGANLYLDGDYRPLVNRIREEAASFANESDRVHTQHVAA